MSNRRRRAREKARRHASPVRRGLRRATLSGSLAATAALGLAAGAEAEDFEVTKTEDTSGTCEPADCSLREALTESLETNSLGLDNITFASSVTGTITLGGTQLFVDGPLNLFGPGADQLTVSADNSSRVLLINTEVGDDVYISGLTLSDANAPAVLGGAIGKVEADLTLSNAAISGSTARYGGGISSSTAGSLTVEYSTIYGNQAYSAGGRAGGGGIHVRAGGPVTITSSTIYNNLAETGTSDPGTSADGGGIDISLTAGPLTVEHSTVSGNAASATNVGAEYGGGISERIGTDPVLSNTIVADNTASTFGPDLHTDSEFDGAFALVEQTSGLLSETVADSNIAGQDPQLLPLASNGGPTPTMALSPSSPAVDQGSSDGAPTDQRGFPRIFDFPSLANSAGDGADGADIGAFELPETPAQPSAPAGPSNAFSFGKLQRNVKKGIAFLLVNLPGPGEVGLRGKGLKTIGGAGVARASRAVAGGTVKLKVEPVTKGKRARKIRRALLSEGSAKVKALVTYLPTGGTANTQARKLKLKKKL